MLDTTSDTIELAARGLDKRYGSLKALDQVSFHVSRGEAVGIVGPNGAGKTTLFGALAGTFPVSDGRVLFRGRDVTNDSPEVRNGLGIARTYQVPRPFLGMTVFENVLVAARRRINLRRPWGFWTANGLRWRARWRPRRRWFCLMRSAAG